jgi:SAM-dependent methyltransferase
MRKQHKLDLLVGPIGCWKKLQEYQLNFLCRMGLKPHHSLLDVGCGPLQGGIAYIKYLDPGNYVGIDIRHEPITEAYKLIAQEGLVYKNPTLIISDNFGRDQLNNHKFDYIWISQLLYHLDEKQIEFFFKQIAPRMKPDSCLYGDIIGYPNKIGPGSYWSVFRFHLHSFDFLSDIVSQFGLTMRPLGQIHQFGYPAKIGLNTNEMLEFRKGKSTT